MDIYQKLTELRSAASENWWIDSNTVFSDCDCDAHGGTDIAFSGNIEDVTFAFALANALPELQRRDAEQRRKLEAAAAFADEVETHLLNYERGGRLEVICNNIKDSLKRYRN